MATETINRPPRFQRSIDTQMLMDKLSACAVGETISYDTLSEVIGRNVRNGAVSSLTSARRALENEKGMAFEAIHNVGLIRLDDKKKVDSAGAMVKGIHRRARRVKKRLGTVDLAKLDEHGRRAFDATATLAGVIDVMSSSSGQKRIEQRVSASKASLPLAATLQAFLE